MKKKNFKLEQINKYDIFCQIWEPEKSPKAVMLLVHGLGEHSGRYATHFADFYLNKGFVILTFDLPGHGKSSGLKGHIDNFDDYNEILSSLLSYANKYYQKLPIFVFGQSLGGLIALRFIIQSKPAINGAVATSVLIDIIQPVTPLKILLARLLNNVFPTFMMTSDLDTSLLSKDPNVVNKYNTDPLVHRKTSARLGIFLLDGGKFVRENATEIQVPTLLMVGSKEGIVSQQAIHDFCLQSENCTEKVWNGLYHELHNEPEKKKVLDFTAKWLNNHM